MSPKRSPPSGLATPADVDRLEAELRHFRELVEATSDWVWEVDVEGRYTYASPRVRGLLGYAPGALLGRSPFEFMPPDEAQRVGALFQGLAQRQEPFRQLLNVNLHKDGHTVVLETSGVPRFDDRGAFCGYRGIDRDVSERVRAERRLHLSAAALQATAEGILVADSSGAITACNPAFEVMCGLREAALLGTQPTMLCAADGASRSRLWDLVTAAPRWRGEGQCRHRSDHSFDVWLTLSEVRDEGGVLTGYVALVGDQTERRAAEATIRFQATHDALTQLTNRSAFLEAVRRATGEAGQRRAAVLFIDLDGFKGVNDRCGHGAGDLLLAAAARRLERCVRRSDLVARFGGDEFTILLGDVASPSTPARVARACVEALQEPFRINGQALQVGASVGLALFPDDGATVDALVAAADRAMYVAKRAGGGRAQAASGPQPAAPSGTG